MSEHRIPDLVLARTMAGVWLIEHGYDVFEKLERGASPLADFVVIRQGLTLLVAVTTPEAPDLWPDQLGLGIRTLVVSVDTGYAHWGADE